MRDGSVEHNDQIQQLQTRNYVVSIAGIVQVLVYFLYPVTLLRGLGRAMPACRMRFVPHRILRGGYPLRCNLGDLKNRQTTADGSA